MESFEWNVCIGADERPEHDIGCFRAGTCDCPQAFDSDLGDSQKILLIGAGQSVGSNRDQFSQNTQINRWRVDGGLQLLGI